MSLSIPLILKFYGDLMSKVHFYCSNMATTILLLSRCFHRAAQIYLFVCFKGTHTKGPPVAMYAGYLCDLILENQPNYHSWYFEKHQL